jgi:hypothetical protein
MRNLIVAVCLVVFIVTIKNYNQPLYKRKLREFFFFGEEYLNNLETGDYDKAEKTLKKMKTPGEGRFFFLKWVANHERSSGINRRQLLKYRKLL